MDLGTLVTWIQTVIATLGYPGILALIALEGVFPLVPSEIILPLAGSLAAQGRLSLFLLLPAAVGGSALSASLLYGIARWGGAPLVGRLLDRWGRWLLLSRADLDRTQAWFERRGPLMVLIGRFTPGLRTLISVPAGLARMSYPRFLLYTCLGSSVWNGGLLLAGWLLGANWPSVQGWVTPIAPLIYLVLLVLVVVFFARRYAARRGGRS
ncbi:MAG TPA: DedA family protein [Chloroflexia bacterium]|nr:DedA family protein [Chloroflexia bacterium]